MSFENIGVVEFRLLRDPAAEPYRAGDVRRAVEVLTAAVEQEHTFLLYLCAVLFRSSVMDDSAVALVAGDSAETLLYEVLSHRPEFMEFLHQIPFGPWLLERLFFEPLEESCERRSVLTHRYPLAL